MSFNDQHTIELSANGSAQTISFTANRDWSATCSDEWIHVTPSSGSASDRQISISVYCDANASYDDRSGSITINAEDLSRSMTVIQHAAPTIIVPTQSFNLTSDANSIEVEVQANVQYTTDISADWIKQAGSRGLNTDKLLFSIEANETYDDRSATITVKPQDSSIAKQVIIVKQSQKDAVLIGNYNYDMPYGGGVIEARIDANVIFDVQSSVDWIEFVQTKVMSSGTIMLKVKQNDDYDAREGRVTILPQGNAEEQTISVKQAPKPGLVIDKRLYEIAANGGPLSIQLESNVELEVIPQSEWIHYAGYTDTKGLAPGNIILNIDENGQQSVRKGSVTIRCGQLEEDVEIRQFIKASVFPIPAANLRVNDERVNKYCGYDYSSKTGSDNLWETGVYKTWALLREMATVGTRNKDATEIRSIMKSHRPVIGIQMIKSDYEDFGWLAFPESISSSWNWRFSNSATAADGYNHGYIMARVMLSVLFPILEVLNEKVLFMGYCEGSIDSVYEAYLLYYQAHPETTFYCSASSSVGLGGNFEKGVSIFHALYSQPNCACHMASFSNANINHPEWLFPMKEEDCDDIYDAYMYSGRTNDWTFGADGVIGGDNEGVTHAWNGSGPFVGASKVPVSWRTDDEKIWCESSQSASGEATSHAAQVATAKYYLSSLLNLCINPEISLSENRTIIRNTCLEQTVYLGDEVYMIGKRIYPGGLVPKFFSQLPDKVSLSLEQPISLTTSVFKGSIIVGPGVVDADGIPVTEDNYHSMWGKTLYLSPTLLRDCGYNTGDTIELIEYLCMNENAVGTGVLADAFHYIDKQSKTITLY